MRALARELGNCEISDITYQQLKEYLYKQEHLKPSSLAHRVRFIRSFFRWAVDEGHIHSNLAAKIKEPKEEQRIPKFLTEEEVETLRADGAPMEAIQQLLGHARVNCPVCATKWPATKRNLQKIFLKWR